MAIPLRVLILEDRLSDTELMPRELGRAGFDPTWQCVDTEADFLARLQQSPEIILADYCLPAFDAPRALQCLRERELDIPVIVVSGILNEDMAVAALKQGAVDYLLKDRIGRLGEAVRNALLEKRLRNEKRQADDALRQSEACYRDILHSLMVHIAVLDKEGNIVLTNEAWERFARGNTPQGTMSLGVGTNYLEACRHRGEIEVEVLEGLQEVLNGSLPTFTFAYPNHSLQQQRWFLLHATPRPNHDGAVVTHTDITAHKIAEREMAHAHQEALRARSEMAEMNYQLEEAIIRANELAVIAENENRARGVMLASISSILIGVDANDHVTLWNPAAENAFEIAADEVLGQSFQACNIGWDWSVIQDCCHQCLHGLKSVRLDDVRFTRPDGTEGFLGITLAPLKTMMDDPEGFLFLGADITQRKILEGQLVLAQKMESIGQLAAGIAHEINTPTQYVGDNTQFLQEVFVSLQEVLGQFLKLLAASRENAITPELIAAVEAAMEAADMEYLLDEIPKAIEQSLDGITRIAKIVQAMKEFSHPGAEEKTGLDINRAIESTLTVARNEWKYVADMVTDFDPGLPLVPCLPGDFNQVVLNIVINAAHAIAETQKQDNYDKGMIRVSTHQDGNWVEIRIQDSGTGIPEAARSRIFDPFFTTKEVGKGTGQGLAIAHSIVVDKHQGTIHFETLAGQGTTFIIRLPLGENPGIAA